jgi:hypothetical protein
MLSDPDKNSAASIEDAAFYYPTRFGTKLIRVKIRVKAGFWASKNPRNVDFSEAL